MITREILDNLNEVIPLAALYKSRSSEDGFTISSILFPPKNFTYNATIPNKLTIYHFKCSIGVVCIYKL